MLHQWLILADIHTWLTRIRLLLGELSDLGPHYLHKDVINGQTNYKGDDIYGKHICFCICSVRDCIHSWILCLWWRIRKRKKDGKNRTGRKIVIEKSIERKERLQPNFQIFIGWSDQSGYSNCLWVWSPNRHSSENPLILLAGCPLPLLI